MDDQKANLAGGSVTNTYLAALREHRGQWIPSAPDATATLEYHVFADAVSWTDEFPRPIPTELENAFRLVINHRTSLLLGEKGRFQETWDLAKECYPSWPGFLYERCSPNSEIADRISRIRRVSQRKIERFGEWMEKGFPTT